MGQIIQDEKFIHNPDVSVVIITYNQQNYIRQCINSIINQITDFNFEIIIGEDCSTDNTRDICIEYQKSYPERIKLLLQENNQGLIKNYRDVLYLCRGKYIAQCAGDDYWCEEKKLQLQYNCLQSKKGFGFVRTGGYLLENSKLKDISLIAHNNSEGYVFDIAKFGTMSLAASIFFESSLLKYIDFEEFIKREFSLEDYPLNAIMAKHTNFAYLPEKCIVYRRIKNSISQTKQDDRLLHYIRGFTKVRKYLNELYPSECYFDEEELEDMVRYTEIKIMYRRFRYSDAKKIVSQLQTELYKRRRLSKYTSNIVSFYVTSVVFNLKSVINL